MPLLANAFLNKAFPPFSDSFGTDGALGVRWTGSTWTVASGVVTNTPTLGDELITNGDMELDANWANSGSPTTNERSNEQAHGGTYSRKIVAPSSSGCQQNVAVTAHQWYYFTGWLYATAGGGRLNLQGSAGATVTAAEWTQRAVAIPRTTTSILAAAHASAADSTFYFDDASLKQLTLSSLFASVTAVPADNVMVSVLPSTYAGTILPCGVVLSLDSASTPTTFLLAYYDGVTAALYKCVAGTWTSLVSAATTKHNYGRLGIFKSGSSVQLWYSGTQVGTTQTVSDVPAVPRAGIFSVHASNQLAAFDVRRGPIKTISFLGDSIAYGSLITSRYDAYSWRVVDSTKYGIASMKQHAVSGNSIMVSMDTQTEAAATDNADIIIINLGTNDNADDGIQAEYQENLQEIAGTNPNAHIYCMSILNRTSETNRTHNNPLISAAVTAAAAAGVNCTYWDTEGWIDPATDTSDGIHPTVAGHVKIRDQILSRL